MVPLSSILRIFPLAEVVLFPGTLLPLHIFEPRYRAMLADALNDDRTIGMVLLRAGARSEAPATGEARPSVYPVGCAGRVIEHELLPDGRSIIVLQGVTKFRIKSELDVETPYRSVAVQALYEAPAPADQMRIWREDLRTRMSTYLTARSVAESERIDGIFDKLEIERIVNYLCAALPLEVVEKQSLLECATVEQRYRRLCEVIDFKTAEARLGLDSARDVDA